MQIWRKVRGFVQFVYREILTFEAVFARCRYWPLGKTVVFDVGANNGESFLFLAKTFSNVDVYAFEPTPELVELLRKKTSHLENFHVIPFAVGEVEGEATFNVAGLGDWGCSSLLEFESGLEKTWPGRNDLQVTGKIAVKVMRLDTFLRSRNFDKIDFLHIDTQGTDLAVLRSLGEELGKVEAGVIEVPQDVSVMLYKGQHTKEEALRFLDDHHFTVRREARQMNESNIYFRRAVS